MKVIHGFFFLVVVGALGCSDLHYLRKADSAYEIARGEHDRVCVHVKHVKDRAEYDRCEAEKAKLHAIKLELDYTTSALLKGPLPKNAKQRMKAIPKELAQ